MDLKNINHFGIAIYKESLGPKWRYPRGHYDSNGSWVSKPKVKIADEHFKWHCYFVIDLGRASKRPLCMWHNTYVTESTINKMLKAATNSGSALLMSKSNKQLANAVKMVVKLKMAFFGNEDVPVKWLTEEDFDGRYDGIQWEVKNQVCDF